MNSKEMHVIAKEKYRTPSILKNHFLRKKQKMAYNFQLLLGIFMSSPDNNAGKDQAYPFLSSF